MPRKSSLQFVPPYLALVLQFLLPAAASAVVVLPKGSSKPVMGYLVRQDEKSVVVREVLPDGKSREQRFQRDQIDELLITVSPERLAALEASRPHLYREYAEELAEKQRDPEARDAARRLYHIAAVLGEGSLRRGSLLGLAALARSPAEERKFRAAAFLYDAEHDPALIAGRDEAQRARTPAGVEPPVELLSAIRLCRQGKGPQARLIIEKPGVREGLAALARIVTAEELLAACSAKELSDEQLHKLLKAEIALQGSGDVLRAIDEHSAFLQSSWAASVKSSGLSPVPALTLETLTEFDPRACVYRDGKWNTP
jgi:hypothetical protein